MQQGLTIKVDTREFNRALHELIRYSSRDYPTVVNSEAFNLCNEALSRTKAVAKATIKSDPALQPPRGYKTVNAFRKRHGLNPIGGQEMGDYYRWHMKRRMQSANYVRSGWLAPMAVLWKFMKPGGKRFGRARSIRRMGGHHQGWAVPAHGAMMMKTCEVGMFSTQNPGKYSGRPGNPGAIAERGLLAAIPIRMAAMVKRVQDKVAMECAKFSAKLLTG